MTRIWMSNALKRFVLSLWIVASAVLPSFSQQSRDDTPVETQGRWLTETQMKALSNMARRQPVILAGLSCRFADIENPAREHVRFQPRFEPVDQPRAWGWTFTANGEDGIGEGPALQAGFQPVSEDLFEISGVTWVRCKVWHRP